MLLKLRAVLLGAAATMILVTPLDFLQVRLGVHTPSRLPWLVPLEFALLGALLALLGLKANKVHELPAVDDLATILHGSAFVAGYLSTLVGGSGTFALLALSIFAQSVLSPPTTFTWILMVVLGLGGASYEAACVAMGLFAYSDVPSYDRLVPEWLPLLWASGAFVAADLMAHVKEAARG